MQKKSPRVTVGRIIDDAKGQILGKKREKKLHPEYP